MMCVVVCVMLAVADELIQYLHPFFYPPFAPKCERSSSHNCSSLTSSYLYHISLGGMDNVLLRNMFWLMANRDDALVPFARFAHRKVSAWPYGTMNQTEMSTIYSFMTEGGDACIMMLMYLYVCVNVCVNACMTSFDLRPACA